MEFTILNQLMNLVRGNLRTSTSDPSSPSHHNSNNNNTKDATTTTATRHRESTATMHFDGAKSTTSRFGRRHGSTEDSRYGGHRVGAGGAYAKMDDDFEAMNDDLIVEEGGKVVLNSSRSAGGGSGGGGAIRLGDLKGKDVVKTTSVEVRVENVGTGDVDDDDGGCGERRDSDDGEEGRLSAFIFGNAVEGRDRERGSGIMRRRSSAASSEVFVIEMCEDKGVV